MDDQTIFYVLGGALVVIALVLSAIGLRWQGFPGSRGPQLGVTVAVLALVVATGAFAWRSAEDEQEHRETELAEAAEPAGSEGDVPPAQAEVDSEVEATTTTEGTTAGVDGAQVFIDQGCGGCHQLEDAGSDATTGPPLDASLEDEDAAYIETSIVDPNKVIAGGYPPNVMPQSYGQELSPEQLKALVQYLVDATGARG